MRIEAFREHQTGAGIRVRVIYEFGGKEMVLRDAETDSVLLAAEDELVQDLTLTPERLAKKARELGDKLKKFVDGVS